MKLAIYFFAGLAALSALGILVTKNIFHAALMLITCLVAVAGIYFVLHAEFLAVTQIIVYAGGVLVLILFGIMLTLRLSGKGKQVFHQNLVAAIGVSSVLFVILIYAINTHQQPVLETMDMSQHVNTVGFILFTEYVAPFEITGVLLLVSLIVASVIASQLKRNP